jgi:hypothetical protein
MAILKDMFVLVLVLLQNRNKYAKTIWLKCYFRISVLRVKNNQTLLLDQSKPWSHKITQKNKVGSTTASSYQVDVTKNLCV